MGKDPGAADARGSGEARLRAGGAVARRAAGSEDPPGHDRERLGPFHLTEAELTDWGNRIGALTELPFVLALRGELGAGKSVLARAIARGAGVDTPMPSPTFNLLFTYDGPARGAEVFHLDLY